MEQQKKLEKLSHSLAGGAEGSGDDGFRVSLQGAGAAGHGPDPEHSLRLVHHWENLLRLHPQSLDTGAQTGHHLGLAAHEEGQRNRLVLQGAASAERIELNIWMTNPKARTRDLVTPRKSSWFGTFELVWIQTKELWC